MVKLKTFYIIFVFLISTEFPFSLALNKVQNTDKFPILKGPYLCQKPPGNTPEIFSPRLHSSLIVDSYYTFSQNGNLLLFKGSYSSKKAVYFLEQKKGIWSSPQIVIPLSKYEDRHFFLSPDEKSIFFTSKRPLKAGGKEAIGPGIWVIERTIQGWSEPKPLGYPVKPNFCEFYSTVTRNNTVYLARSAFDETVCNIYYSKLVNGKYSEVEDLGEIINSDSWDADPFIAPDESYIIYCSYRPGGYGRYDLYVSYQLKNSSWTEPKNLGNLINSKGNEICPLVTSDDKYFFYVSSRTGESHDYWVNTQFIEELKPNELK